MKKVGICGHYGGKKIFMDGQTIKTKNLTEELKREFGTESVQVVDTCDWKNNPISLVFKCFSLLRNCENVIILPAQKGIKIFVPLFIFINNFYNRKIHYVVIGGWLPQLLDKEKNLKKKVSKLSGVYVETTSMLESLVSQGLNNIEQLPNFKRLNILNSNDLVYPEGEPYRLCTFSRVMKEKGIEEAIEAVKNINNLRGRTVYTLDIYGQVDENYSKNFEELMLTTPDFISYKGMVNYSESVEVLKNYFALLFPTYYEGEGFAGTILDAFAAGVPVIATNWKYNGEIIENYKDGILYDYKNKDLLQEVLLGLTNDPNLIIDMKRECLLRAKQYSPEKVIGRFKQFL